MAKRSKMKIGIVVISVIAVLAIAAVILSGKINRVITDENGFSVDNEGCLISYTGTDTDLILPETVSSIPADAFKESPNAEKIETVRLNSSVNNIDKKAFSGLTSLGSVKVPEENPYFYEKDAMMLKKDGTLVFAFADASDMTDLIYSLRDDADNVNKITDIVIGDCVIRIAFEKGVSLPDPYMISMEAFGNQLVLSEEEAVSGNLMINYFRTDDACVLTRDAHSENTAWIITREDTYTFVSERWYPSANNDGYKDSTYTFYKRDDGKPGYIRCANKFTYEQVSHYELVTCVSRDEFCRAEGYVSFENGELVFNEEKTYSVSDIYDLDKIFADAHEEINSEGENLFEFHGLPEFDTLDELLEYNGGIYEESK